MIPRPPLAAGRYAGVVRAPRSVASHERARAKVREYVRRWKCMAAHARDARCSRRIDTACLRTSAERISRRLLSRIAAVSALPSTKRLPSCCRLGCYCPRCRRRARAGSSLRACAAAVAAPPAVEPRPRLRPRLSFSQRPPRRCCRRSCSRRSADACGICSTLTARRHQPAAQRTEEGGREGRLGRVAPSRTREVDRVDTAVCFTLAPLLVLCAALCVRLCDFWISSC